MIEALRRVATLVAKELAVVMRDPKSRFVVLGPPIIQFFIFGYAATFDVTSVRYAVLDESRTPASRALLARFAGSDHFEHVKTLEAPQEIARPLDTQRVRMVIHVPADFAERLHGPRPAPVQVLFDGRNSNVASVARGYAGSIVAGFNARRAVTGEAAVRAAGPRLVERAWFNENLTSRWSIVSPLGGVISMVVVTLLAALSVARERELGTFDQLLVAPFRPAEILVGKAAPGVLFGLADALLLSAGAVHWFEVPFRGTIPALVAALGAFVVAVVGIGLLISSLSTTMQQGLLGSFAFVMPAVILGGFTTPIENMPEWLQAGTLVNPLRYVVEALRAVFLKGEGIAGIAEHLWPMLAIAAVTLPAAAWMFRHRAG